MDYVPVQELPAGKRVLVTAAAGTGIGFATAKRCIEEGARVVVSDAHERRLAETAAELGVASAVCDVTDETHVQRLFETAVEELDGLDIVVNNAGLGGTANVVDMTDEQWTKVLDVTLNGTFRCMRPALRLLQAQGNGVIVNNASVLGWRAQAGRADHAGAQAAALGLPRGAGARAAPLNRGRQGVAASHPKDPLPPKA